MQKKPVAVSGDAETAQIVAILRSQAESIARQWHEAVCAKQGAAAAGALGVEPMEVLRQLADRLDQGGTSKEMFSPPRVPSGRGCAAGMILAFGRLRQTLVVHLASGLGRELRGTEVAAINSTIDEVMARQAAGSIDQELRDLRCGDEMQARYMSFLSHDLRGSLNGLVLMLEVMRRELLVGDASETTEDIALMRQSVLDAVTTVERYVQADRLRRGKVPVNRQRVELRPIIEAAESALSDDAREKQIAIEMDVPDGAFVEADPELTRQTLVNLLENAIEYGERGPIAIVAQQAGNEWVISVADQGPGIDPDRLERLIDPVRRCELKERGIGLTIAYYAMRLLGGRIEAESMPGRGSVFRMILPAASAVPVHAGEVQG